MATPATGMKLFKNCKFFPNYLLRGSVSGISSSILTETKIVGDQILQPQSSISAQYFLGSQPSLAAVYRGTIDGCSTLLLTRYRGSEDYDEDDSEDDPVEDFDDIDEYMSSDDDDNDEDDEDGDAYDNDTDAGKRKK